MKTYEYNDEYPLTVEEEIAKRDRAKLRIAA